jgi:hypothetical protein
MSDDDRIAYLSGDFDASVDPAEREELDDVRRLLADPALWVEPPPELQERIVGAIAGSGAADESRRQPSAPPGTDELARRRAARIRYTVAGLAAAIVLAVGIGVVVTNSHGGRPVQFAAALRGTGLAPSASGAVTLTRTTSGWRIHLNASGLPRRENGEYYEAWLKSSTGVLVPVGTFNESADVTLWAGVPPASFPTFTITRQQADSGPASSKQVVLTGLTHPK